MPTDIVVPQLGESVTEATIAKWFKAIGEPVTADEPLVELETDKVTVEVPAPVSGVLKSISAEQDAEVTIGAVLGTIEEGAAASAAPAGGNGAAAVAAVEPAPAPAAAAPAPAKGGEATPVVVPQLGESVTTGTVSKWFKQPGEAVAVDEPVAELETDKVTVEVPSTVAGVIAEHKVAEGADVEVGAVLFTVTPGDGSAAAAAPAPAPAKAEAAKPAAAPAPQAAPAPAPAAASPAATALSPSVLKLIAEHRLNAADIPASGAKGQLTKGDVLAFIESGGPERVAAQRAAAPAAAPVPAAGIVPAAELPPRTPDPREEVVRMSKLRQRIAVRLKEAQNTAAMLTTFNEIDMSAVMEMRAQYRDSFEKKHGVRLGFMGIFVKAAIQALQELPAVNGEIYGDQMIYKNYYNIGVAVGTEQGLVVPVLKDADQMSLAELEGTIADFGKRARDGKLAINELTGGTFTITNGGVFGSLLSTPILNPPQSGILGMHKTQKRPVAIGDKIEIRPMMYVALSYDHRIIDGREAVTFLVRVKQAIEDPQRLVLGV